MTTIPQLVEILQELLTSVADRIARETGFERRESKLGGAEFSQTLVFGWLANPEATLNELVQTAATLGIIITEQGLDNRFTAPAAECLRQILATAVGMVVSARPAVLPILQRFNGVYIQDSTTITLPEALADLWHGCGNAHGTGQAALKVQVQFDYSSGTLSQIILQDGRAQDRNAPVQDATLPVGALRLADLGYFNLPVLASLSQQDVYWLTRLQAGTVIYQPAGERLDLLALLQAQDHTTVEQEILVGSEQRLPCRLLAARVPQAVADKRRHQLHTEARHKGQTVSAARLALADWTIFITNAPCEKLTLYEALTLARCRWQIELLFKLWKSQGQIDTSRSANPWRVLCEVYAKLLAMLVQHWLFLVSCWAYPDRSLVKAAQTVRGHALHLAAHLACAAQLIEVITVIQNCLAAGCRINKRRAAPHTYQLLAALDDNFDDLHLHMTDSDAPSIA
jgi:hypothetical protein